MSFEDILGKAEEEWREFSDGSRNRVLVGTGTCGKAAGADDTLCAINDFMARQEAIISEVGCLGLCYAEPLVELSRPGSPRVLYQHVTADQVPVLLQAYFEDGKIIAENALAVMERDGVNGVPAFAELPMVKEQVRMVLRNCGRIDPGNAAHYLGSGGYQGLRKALSMEPDEVVAAVEASGLRGRGGAGFPTGTKWRFCRQAEGEHKYLICNADEGDPGAFMDRSVIESDPHTLMEGMIIAAYAIGADHGYIYCRAEYPLAIARLRTAIDQARGMGLLGENILGSGFNFDVRIKEGAGAFVCGEESALIASIEGKRGMPRPRPPFPAQKGLHGMPTTINNVETLANIPVIMDKGANWFASFGTEQSRGTKTFALAGKINRTGLIEVPLGISLRDIVYDIGGGIPGGKPFKAVQTGGPSGGCVPASLLDVKVDYQNLAAIGAIMGSGGMVVMDEDTCMVDVARYFVEFTQNESCGKCVPCRLGTRQLLQILEDITQGRGREGDLDLLSEIAESVKLGSLCGLGQTAPNPVLTTLKYYRDEYDEHVQKHRCPAGACEGLVRYTIDEEACTGCTLCARHCPVDAISGEKKQPHVIDQDVCVYCGVCHRKCRFEAVRIV